MKMRVGIAGATGLVGEALLRVLESGPHEIAELRLFASAASAGARLSFRDQEYAVQEVVSDGFRGLDVAFFCIEAELARRLVPEAAKHCPVIDKSSEFRLKEHVPLVVPEVNPEALAGHKNIIANPNCTTIPLVVAVNPLHRRFGLERIWLASYQSASGAGRAALEQLQYETEFVALRRAPDTQDSSLPAQLADNVIPQIDRFDNHGHTGEELKTMRESARILGLPELKVASTCVRVPVSVGHALAVTCRFAHAVKVKDALHVLKDAPGVVLYDRDRYVTPVLCRGSDAVYVCRVRPGTDQHELSMWVVTDNLRKGAATNAVQIAELVMGHNENDGRVPEQEE
ncbi:aspartate-semialdehyde dehydrogenase [candidate division WOR-3 bacterium]|nr:aspartate-semialdehyde dehydrogenase [candidate division WOR-3 bacterium]